MPTGLPHCAPLGGSELSPPFWLDSNQNGNVYKPPSRVLRANPKQMKSLYPSLPNTTVRYICYFILREARSSARLMGNCCWLSLSARSLAQRVKLPTHSPALYTSAASNSITQRTHGGARRPPGATVLEVLKHQYRRLDRQSQDDLWERDLSGTMPCHAQHGSACPKRVITTVLQYFHFPRDTAGSL